MDLLHGFTLGKKSTKGDNCKGYLVLVASESFPLVGIEQTSFGTSCIVPNLSVHGGFIVVLFAPCTDSHSDV